MARPFVIIHCFFSSEHASEMIEVVLGFVNRLFIRRLGLALMKSNHDDKPRLYDREDVGCEKRLCSPSETVVNILEFCREAVLANWLGGEGCVLLMPRPFVVIQFCFRANTRLK